MKSVAIIGKGPSILKCSSKYLDNHDDIILCNKPVFKGYESNIPFRGNIQFRNNSTPNFSQREVDLLGLNEIFTTAANFEKINAEYKNVNFKEKYLEDTLFWNTNEERFKNAKGRYEIETKYGAKINNPTTGMIAFTWAVLSGRYNEITLVGFDVTGIKNEKVYYFKTSEYQENLKYLLGTIYTSDGRFKHPNHGDENETIEFFLKTFSENKNIKFNLLTNNHKLSIACSYISNVNLIKS